MSAGPVSVCVCLMESVSIEIISHNEMVVMAVGQLYLQQSYSHITDILNFYNRLMRMRMRMRIWMSSEVQFQRREDKRNKNSIQHHVTARNGSGSSKFNNKQKIVRLQVVNKNKIKLQRSINAMCK